MKEKHDERHVDSPWRERSNHLSDDAQGDHQVQYLDTSDGHVAVTAKEKEM